MTTAAMPDMPVKKKHLQAKGTVGILNTVRWVGTAAYALVALIGVLYLLMSVHQPNTSWTSLVMGVGLVLGSLIFGALFYAIVGWYVDTLDLLHKLVRRVAA
jgi:hypothetical protein